MYSNCLKSTTLSLLMCIIGLSSANAFTVKVVNQIPHKDPGFLIRILEGTNEEAETVYASQLIDPVISKLSKYNKLSNKISIRSGLLGGDDHCTTNHRQSVNRMILHRKIEHITLTIKSDTVNPSKAICIAEIQYELHTLPDTLKGHHSKNNDFENRMRLESKKIK